jgi:hypothetical protein
VPSNFPGGGTFGSSTLGATGRAQFRDTVLLLGAGGTLVVPPAGAQVAVYDVGTSNPIADVLYADASSSATLPNPMFTEDNGLVDFWTLEEREIDLVVTCPGYQPQRVTVTTDAAGGGGGAGEDIALRTYVQHIMGVLDPSGPPAP